MSVKQSARRRKSVSHVADQIIIYRVGLLSLKTYTKHSCNTPKGTTLPELLRLWLPSLTGNGWDRWSEAVQNIDFSHSSWIAWSTLNNLTGRSRQFLRQCYVSANAIASQLVENKKYESANRETSRLVMQELSDC